MSADLDTKIALLHKYSPCDVADALLRLQQPVVGQVPRAGHLIDIGPIALPANAPRGKVIGKVSTLQIVGKHDGPPELAADHPNAIPPGQHWVDLTDPGTVVLIEQPPSHVSAAIGGVLGTRMKARGVLGCVVGGRVRDVEELINSNLPVFARAKSIVASGQEARPHARNVPVTVAGVTVTPGDIIMCDPLEGIVVIPIALLDDTLAAIPKIASAGQNAIQGVLNGASVMDIFIKYRTV